MDDSTFFLDLPEKEFLEKLRGRSVWKERSDKTLSDIQWPELRNRTGVQLPNLQCSNTPDQQSNSEDDPYAIRPDLLNESSIEIVYLGNSMLERLKTTGASTQLAQLSREGVAWNAGCGGDKNENVIYRLICGEENLLSALKASGNVRLWVLMSGTNNLRKKPFRSSDLESYRLLLQACLWMAPESKIIACDMFYRKDIPDTVVNDSNKMMESVVKEVNQGLLGREGVQEIQWVEARTLIEKELLEDHVHLTEEGYRKLNDILWPWVRDFLGNTENDEAFEDKENRSEP